MSGLQGCATLAARVTAGLAAAALVILLPVSLLARNIASVLFEPRALTRIVSARLIETGLLRDTIIDSLLGDQASSEDLSFQPALRHLTAGQRETVFSLLAPEGWAKEQLLHVTTDFLAWFDSPTPRLVLTVDTGQVAARLGSDSAARAVEIVVESWPACTLEDVGKMVSSGAIPGEQGFPYCEPPEPLRGLVVSTAVGALQLVKDSLPASVAIIDQSFDDSDRLMEIKEQVRLAMFVARWGVLAALSLLGVITVFAVRSWRSLALWWGVPLLLGGLLAFLPVAFVGPLLGLLVSRLTAGLSAIPALAEMAEALAEAMSSAVLRPQAWQAAIISAVGLALLLLSLFRRRPSGTPATAASQAHAPASEPLVPPPSADETKDRPSGMFG